MSARQFLLRGLLAGAVAGLLTFAVAFLVGEPSLHTAIALEETAGDQAHEPAAVVPRSLQSTLGLLTATLATGVTLGGLLGLLTALGLGRLAGLGPRALVMLLAATGFVALHLTPYAVFPPNPPAVGDPGTIGQRTGTYFALVAVSVLAAAAATAVGARLAGRIGGWYATLAAGAGYLAAVTVAAGLMPRFDEVPAGYPASLLWEFRTASLVTQATLWLVLGVALAELAHRLVAGRGSGPARPAIGGLAGRVR